MKKVLFGLVSISMFAFAGVDTSVEPVDNTNVFSSVGKIRLTGNVEAEAPSVKYVVFAGLTDDPAQGSDVAGLGTIKLTSYSLPGVFNDSSSSAATGKIFVRKVGASGVEALGTTYSVSLGGNSYNSATAVNGGDSLKLPIFQIFSDEKLEKVFTTPTYTVQDGKIYLGASVAEDKIMNSATMLQFTTTVEGDMTAEIVSNPNPSGSSITPQNEKEFFDALVAGQSNLSFDTPVYIKVGK